MPYYRSVGEVPRKRHTRFHRPDGQLYTEELFGAEGFSAESALLYHHHLPAAITDSTVHPVDEPTRSPNLPLKPRHLRPRALEQPDRDAVTGRAHLLANDDVRLSYVAADRPSPLYRNAVGDECVYVESGTAAMESVFGVITAGPGDYVIVPTSTTHRWVPDGGEPLRLLVICARGHIGTPPRYVSATGQFLESAPYCERDLRAPTQPLCLTGTERDTATEVLVAHRGGWTRLTYPQHPFDVVGWDGALYPYAFNIADFEPITGRVHQPPPVHQTFAGPNFVVCSFVPRKLDYHPQAVPIPYHHHNVDSDEVLFYVAGDYAARRGSGIGAGSISLHPGGCAHGPQPGAAERALGAEAVDELAVMVDTFRPLELCEPGLACEDTDYAWSWVRGHDG